jgi:uncharacterized phage protein (TIGR01671 family)
MEEIRLRAWDKVQKRMSCSFTLGDLYGYEGELNAVTWECGDDVWQLCSHNSGKRDGAIAWAYPQFEADNGPNPALIFLLYTGLKDKDGRKEICQNDIVRDPDTRSYDQLLLVQWGGEFNVCGFVLTGTKPHINERVKFTHDQLNHTWDGKLEIVGNIYENPELLDKGE